MIPRPDQTLRGRTTLERNRFVALIGPRQAGKTTLARNFVPMDTLNYFDDHLAIIYPGARSYPLADRVTAVPLEYIVQEVDIIFFLGVVTIRSEMNNVIIEAYFSQMMQYSPVFK
ncbi:MAG: hypothetical protein BMS9Abin02_1753 [Anaerolineae bacterium]|nr:MAG: hypothetical protein BMS9Abin02_1753 [Anaerolineae bacterium]